MAVAAMLACAPASLPVETRGGRACTSAAHVRSCVPLRAAGSQPPERLRRSFAGGSLPWGRCSPLFPHRSAKRLVIYVAHCVKQCWPIDNADLLRNADASRSVRAAPAGPTRFAAPDSEPMTPLRACRPSALRAAPRCASRAARSAWGDRDDRVGAEARRLAERATAEAEREVRGQLRVLACGLPWQLWPASEP